MFTHRPGFFAFSIYRDDATGEVYFRKEFHEVSSAPAEDVISVDHKVDPRDEYREEFGEEFIGKIRSLKDGGELDPFELVELIIGESEDPTRFNDRVVDILVDVISNQKGQI